MQNQARRKTASAPELIVGGVSIPRGATTDVELEVVRLPTRTQLTLPVRVVHGFRPGPRIWISAAIHGDELNGIEIVRRILDKLDPSKLRGAVLAVPIVNLHGFLNQSRYLPDGRDLNRVFPGSARGSLAARLAHLFMKEIVAPCTLGMDFHTAAGDRTNLPQVRADLEDAETRACAQAFGAQIAVHSRIRDGSLREAATRDGARVLLFEGGQARRFEEDVVAAGVRGARRVLSHLGMVKLKAAKARAPRVAYKSSWLRAPRSGMLRSDIEVGDEVRAGQVVGTIADAFGDFPVRVKASHAGVVIGAALNPVVNQGDAVVHIAHDPVPFV